MKNMKSSYIMILFNNSLFPIFVLLKSIQKLFMMM